MGKGYKHGGSGGANPLNFTVKTYPSEVELKADKPKENTIGVITTTTMTSWVFSATEPKEPEVGMVWVRIGVSSASDFNALKKNTLQVYPLSAKQYVDSTWKEVTTMIYQDVEWAELLRYLYKSGNEFVDFTGGWTCKPYRVDGSSSYTPVTIPLTKNDDHILLSSSFGDNTSTIICHEKPIDLTEWSTVTIEFEVTRTAVKCASRLQICDTALSGSSKAAVMLFDSAGVYGDGKASVDISSLSGEHIIGIPIWAPDPSTITFKLKLSFMK